MAAGWDRWAKALRWAPDGSALVVGADESGAAPLFRVDLPAGGDDADQGPALAAAEPVRLTADHGAYAEFEVSPDGESVHAVRSAVNAPPAPVRVPVRGSGDGAAAYVHLPRPAEALDRRSRLRPPGALRQVTATAADGTPLRAWLVLPPDASEERPAPLLLWIHGGPLASWNAWSWRWNPWVMARHGYAVLLPDPGLSTGSTRS